MGSMYSPSARLISIHALREEGDRPVYSVAHYGEQFQSTPSARRATGLCICHVELHQDFNPRPPRGGRRSRRHTGNAAFPISIHALREEGDLLAPGRYLREHDFNPRPPRGGRLLHLFIQPSRPLFQSTPSARRATPGVTGCEPPPSDFNPRPPRGGRRRALLDANHHPAISIHALREEGDCLPSCRPSRRRRHFNPRPPRGGRLYSTEAVKLLLKISIHALREEGDCNVC